MGIKVGTGL